MDRPRIPKKQTYTNEDRERQRFRFLWGELYYELGKRQKWIDMDRKYIDHINRDKYRSL